MKDSSKGGFLFALSLVFLPSVVRATDSKLVAVLPFNYTNAKLDRAQRAVIEEDVRNLTTNILSPAGFTVLTSETTLRVLQDNGVDLDRVCEATCALEAAREMKVRYFLSGSIATSEGEHIAFVRIFDSKDGRTLSSVKVEGSTAKDLRASLELESRGLFARAGLAEAGQAGPAVNPALPVPKAAAGLRVRGDLLGAAARSAMNEREAQAFALQKLLKELRATYFDAAIIGSPTVVAAGGTTRTASVKLRMEVHPNPDSVQVFLDGLKQISKGSGGSICLRAKETSEEKACFSMYAETMQLWKDQVQVPAYMNYFVENQIAFVLGKGDAVLRKQTMIIQSKGLAEVYPDKWNFSCRSEDNVECPGSEDDFHQHKDDTPYSTMHFDVVVKGVPLDILNKTTSMILVRG
jgi:TolB-like protein